MRSRRRVVGAGAITTIAAAAIAGSGGRASADVAGPPAQAGPARPSAPGAYYDRREPLERDGFFVGLGLGSSTFIARDIAIDGVGPHLSLHMGTPVSRRLLLVFQADFINAELSEANADDKDRINFLTATVGVQWYWKNTIWLKGGLGGAQLARRRDSDGRVDRFLGLGSALSVGLDLLRRRSLVIDVEIVANQGVSGQGVVSGSGLAIGGTWY